MLDQIQTSWSVLVPGEFVPLNGAVSSVIVYPLALAHVKRFQHAVASIFMASQGIDWNEDGTADVPSLVTAVTPILVGPAAELLTACCKPDPKDFPLSSLVSISSSWIEQSLGWRTQQAEIDPDGGDDEEGGTFEIELGTMMAQLVEAGHDIQKILHGHQVGCDGAPCPFPGWTIRQFHWWSRALSAAGNLRLAAATESLVVAISAAIAGKDGAEQLADYLRDLRSAREPAVALANIRA